MKIKPLKTPLLFLQRMIALFVILSMSALTYAQKVSAEVAEVIDTRVSSRITDLESATLLIRIEVAGLETDSRRLLKPGILTQAVDNRGNAIQIDESTYDSYSNHTILNYRLISTERSISEISVLEGTVKYFNPTIANKGLVMVDKPVDKLSTNILKGKHSDIVIVILDRKKLQTLKKENEKAYKQELDKIKKEYGVHADNITELNEILDDPYFGNDNELFFFFYDGKARVRELKILNAEGENLYYGNSVTGNHISYHLSEEPLSNKMKIEMTIETPQAIKEYPFKLEKIKLP